MTAATTAATVAALVFATTADGSSSSGRRLIALAWLGTVPVLSAADLTARL